MPRSRRIDAPGAVHHVMVRGVDRAPLFLDDADRARFMDVARRVVPEEGAVAYAWALMPNHVHVVLRSGPAGLSRLMARIGTTHALAFNRRHGRVGHLFQDRFKSVLVDSDVHFRWLLRYVHRNPIEGGLVSSLTELDDYPWTGHRELVRDVPRPLVARTTVLAWFAPDPTGAVKALRRWMDDPEPEAEAPPGEAGLDSDLVEPVVAQVVKRAAAIHGVDPAALWRGSRARPVSAARARAIRELHERHGISAARIERILGLSRGAAIRALRRAPPVSQ